MKKLVGSLAILMLAGAASFSVFGYDDDYVNCSDDTVRHLTVGGREVYVFTNSTAASTLTSKRTITNYRYLVCGGGGSGGWTIGGGGGGGGVVTGAVERIIPVNTVFGITVGAGAKTMASGSYSNGWAPGAEGAASSFRIGSEAPFEALGGGGGGSWSSTAGHGQTTYNVACGGGGCHGAAGGAGLAGQGYSGGNGSSESPGGGGGAGAAGGVGTASGAAGRGGEGIASDITGTTQVYGSGGGGGAGNSCTAGSPGGTNAGAGANRNTGLVGESAIDGFGGGGGGGGYNGATRGGFGGNGTVILSYEFDDTYPMVGFAREPESFQHELAFHFKVSSLGEGAAGVAISLAYAKTNTALGSYVPLTNCTACGSFDYSITGLELAAAYDFSFKIDNGLHVNYLNGTLSTPPVRGSGGVISMVGGDYVHGFTAAGDFVFTAPPVPTTLRVLMVAGGGAGGNGGNPSNGGCGGEVSEFQYNAAAGERITLHVGAGGLTNASLAANGGYGGNSVFTADRHSLTLAGGQGGCQISGSGRHGGWGNGLKNAYSGITGGAGLTSDITGESLGYGGGGGGGSYNGNNKGGAGTDGGGNGDSYDGYPNSSGSAAVAGVRGGGGGGGGNYNDTHRRGANGGNGLVYIRYAAPVPALGANVTVADSSCSSARLVATITLAPGVGETVNVYFASRRADGGEALVYGAEPIASGLHQEDQFAVTMTRLLPGIEYDYSFKLIGSASANPVEVSGSFVARPYVSRADAVSMRRLDDGTVVMTFTNDCEVVLSEYGDIENVRYLVVGGGGAGGSGKGGGGGGEVVTGKVGVVAGQVIHIAVGGGGVTSGAAGGDSTLVLGEGAPVTAKGGKGGGSPSGGASGNGNTGGSAASGAGCGGGGAGAVGAISVSGLAGKGGDGILVDITGESVYYGGGGGGGGLNGNNYGNLGGAGGGGWGAYYRLTTTNYTNISTGYQLVQKGTDGLGGGGGGASNNSGYTAFGGGGCGCVVLRFTPSTVMPATPMGTLDAVSVTETALARIEYDVAWAGANSDYAAVTARYWVVGSELTNLVELAAAAIGGGVAELELPLGEEYGIELTVSSSDGVFATGSRTLTMPPASGFSAADPVIDKENRTVQITGSLDSVGCGTTTLTLEYGKTSQLGSSLDLVTDVEYGAEPVGFDTGVIECYSEVRENRIPSFHYRFVLTETVGGREAYRVETPINKVKVFGSGSGLMVIWR